jgi:RNA polymerase sigma factor (sigma-70 family)
MQTTAYTEKEMIRVAQLIVSRTHLTDENDREDLFQELMLGMHNAAQKADPAGNVKAYQWVTAKGIALDFFNGFMDRINRFETSLYTLTDVDGEEGVAKVYTEDSGSPSGLDVALADDRTKAIENALASLPEREAIVVKRHLLNGETLTSIANDNGFTVQYAHQILTSAKGKLANALAEWNPLAA